MISSRVLFGSVLMSSVSLFCGAQAADYQVLHVFAGAPNDGSFPFNPVIFDDAGDLYGTTNLGGASDNGTIFKLAPDGTETLLHSFAGGAQGSDPNAGVTLDPTTGNLYGSTTFGGGAECRNGCGILYKLAADGTYKVLHTFDAAADGSNPAGLLTRDTLGNLYGIATSGGPNSAGTVYSVSAKGKFRVLHAFGGADGFEPQGHLLRDKAGNLYGVTFEGGADGCGTVYTLGASGKGFSVLYSFTCGAEGGNPSGGLDRDKHGNLYGATNLSGNGGAPNGTVFKLAPDGTLTTLHTFTGGADGGFPMGDVLLKNGKVYGTTTSGGAQGAGIVYAIDSTDGTQTVLHNFAGSKAANPQAGLTAHHGHLYATAPGSSAGDAGVVFSVRRK